MWRGGIGCGPEVVERAAVAEVTMATEAWRVVTVQSAVTSVLDVLVEEIAVDSAAAP